MVNPPHLNQSRMMFLESNINQIFKPWDIQYDDKSGSTEKNKTGPGTASDIRKSEITCNP